MLTKAASISLGLFGLLTALNAIADCETRKVFSGQQYLGCEVEIDDVGFFEIDASKLSPLGCDRYCKNHYISERQALALINEASERIPSSELECSDSDEPPKLLGRGVYGKIFGDESNVIKVPAMLLSLRDVHSICESFEKEVQLKERVLSAIRHAAESDVPLSPLVQMDPGRYAEEDLGRRHDHSPRPRIKSCWMLMRKLSLNDSTRSKHSSRKTLYTGDLTSEKRELIKAVGQVYALHLIGAGLDIPNDLELAVGTVKDRDVNKPVVTLIDYGLVQPLRDTTFYSSDPHRRKPLVICLDTMRSDIPDPRDREKFAIFKESFLSVAQSFHQRDLALRMLTYLEDPGKLDEIVAEERERARAAASSAPRLVVAPSVAPLSVPPVRVQLSEPLNGYNLLNAVDVGGR